MNITFYNLQCRMNQINKTGELNLLGTTTFYFKGSPYDELFPIVILTQAATYKSANYVYIDETKSYYFIKGRTNIDSNLIELRLEKDVLYSNKSAITTSSAIFKRSTYYGSEQMFDSTTAFDSVETISHTSLLSYAVSNFNINDKGHIYLLVYLDDGLGLGGISNIYTNFTNTYDDGIRPTINDQARDLGYQQTGTNYRVMTYTQLFMLSRAIINDSSLLSAVKGVYKIPMATSTTDETKFRLVYTGDHEIRLGKTTIDLRLNSSDTTELYAPYSMRSRWVFEDFTLFTNTSDNKFYKHNPYTRYEIWCPFVGWVEIPSANIINKQIKIFYTFNLENGESTCNFYDVSSNTIIMTKTANAFLSISLDSTNLRELQDRTTSLALNTFIGALSSIIAIGGGVATANPIAIGGGVISLGKTVSNAVTGAIGLHPQASVSLQNINSSWLARIDFVLRITKKQEYEIDKNIIGRPCNVYNTIGNETGYCECVNVDTSNLDGLSKDEIDKILYLLEKGVYA